MKKPATKQTDLGGSISLEDIKKLIRESIKEQLNRLQITKLIKEELKRLQRSGGNNEDDSNDADDPMDVDITRVQEARDLATIEGKIDGKPVSVVLDSASNRDIMPKFVFEMLGLESNTDTTYHVRGMTGENTFTESAKASVSLAPGCVIETTFIINDKYRIPEVILGRSTLKRYNYDLFESRDHAIFSCNGKEFFIPIVPDKNRQKN